MQEAIEPACRGLAVVRKPSTLRRIILLLLLPSTYLTLTCLLSSCGTPEPDLTWQRIQEQGVIRVGMDANWIPFEYVNGAGQLSGFDVELTRELGKRLGLEVQFVANLSFDGLYDALTANRVDLVVSAIVVDPNRSADFGYSTAYFDAGQVLIIGSQNVDIEGMEDLKGHVLAVELGSDGDTVARRWARRMADLSLLHTESVNDAVAAVTDGRADAAITDRATALLVLKARGDAKSGLRISGSPLTDERYAMVVRRESSALLHAINSTLADIHGDGTLQRLESAWLGPSGK